MCLGLEMLRGGDIRVVETDIQVGGQGGLSVETPTDVRVYVDERCPETVGWFERSFCVEGREGRGVKLDVGGEQIIIFATRPELPPTPDDGTIPPRPALTLLLGRAAVPKTRRPRPDDPMPRETLFASKLRRTSSLPVLAFPLPSTHPNSKPALSRRPSKKAKEKERHVRGLLSGKDTLPPSQTLSRTSSSRNLVPRPPPAEGDLFSTATSRRPRRFVPPSKESSSSDEDEVGSMRGLPASPTPSVATTFGGGLDDDDEERMDVVPELGGFGKRKPISRSTSAPAGVFNKLNNARPPREQSEGPEATIEGKNKATLKKILLGRLVERGVERAHADFRDVFSLVLKGVQYALRANFCSELLNRPRAAGLIDKHLDMYVDSRPDLLPPSPKSLGASGL